MSRIHSMKLVTDPDRSLFAERHDDRLLRRELRAAAAASRAAAVTASASDDHLRQLRAGLSVSLAATQVLTSEVVDHAKPSLDLARSSPLTPEDMLSLMSRSFGGASAGVEASAGLDGRTASALSECGQALAAAAEQLSLSKRRA